MTELENTLETLIDQHGLGTLLAALSNVCFAKAEHVQTNWQDKALAKAWSTSGKRLDKVR